jgi:hypothetical protein
MYKTFGLVPVVWQMNASKTKIHLSLTMEGRKRYDRSDNGY